MTTIIVSNSGPAATTTDIVSQGDRPNLRRPGAGLAPAWRRPGAAGLAPAGPARPAGPAARFVTGAVAVAVAVTNLSLIPDAPDAPGATGATGAPGATDATDATDGATLLVRHPRRRHHCGRPRRLVTHAAAPSNDHNDPDPARRRHHEVAGHAPSPVATRSRHTSAHRD